MIAAQTAEFDLEHALRLAAAGVAIYAADSCSAALHVPPSAASTDPEIVRGWWTTWPGACVGVTGLVLRVHGSMGERALAAVQARHGGLPEPALELRWPDGRRIVVFPHAACFVPQHAPGLALRGRGELLANALQRAQPGLEAFGHAILPRLSGAPLVVPS